MWHFSFKLRIYVVTLYLNNATTTDSGFKTVVIKVLKVDIFNVLPVREEEFHCCCSDTLYCLKISHISVFVILNELVKEDTIHIFRT